MQKRRKTYAELKDRLRNAGMPTGGKKRKLFERLKTLDDQEADVVSRPRYCPLHMLVLSLLLLHCACAELTWRHPQSVDEPKAGLGMGMGGDRASVSEEQSDVDERFQAVFTDPDFELDTANEKFSMVGPIAQQTEHFVLPCFRGPDQNAFGLGLWQGV